ncbi:hypothetical protein ABDK00_007315 [Niabella insulamsoli]|uniref:hypothetical protein n=1 Tax=Niabella insulamsoli TaxID=3144874 RepID=UPI0031FDD946
MKFFISLIVTGIFSFIAGRYFPWWSLAIVAFLVSLLIAQRPLTSFISGFLALFLVWLILALLINAENGSILANRVGGMLGIGQQPVMLAVLSAFIGGLVAGFAALSASFLRKTS